MSTRRTAQLVAEQAPSPPGAAATALLERALVAMHHDGGTDAVAELLRGNADEVVRAAAEWVERDRATNPLLAWSLLYAVDRAGLGEALELFAREALRPVEQAAERGCWSEADMDELVAVQAVEGLGRLVAAGEGRALEALLDVVGQQRSRAVRIAAARVTQAVAKDVEDRLDMLLGEDAECLRWEVVPVERLAADADELERPKGSPKREPVPPPVGRRLDPSVSERAIQRLRPLAGRGRGADDTPEV